MVNISATMIRILLNVKSLNCENLHNVRDAYQEITQKDGIYQRMLVDQSMEQISYRIVNIMMRSRSVLNVIPIFT